MSIIGKGDTFENAPIELPDNGTLCSDFVEPLGGRVIRGIPCRPIRQEWRMGEIRFC